MIIKKRIKLNFLKYVKSFIKIYVKLKKIVIKANTRIFRKFIFLNI